MQVNSLLSSTSQHSEFFKNAVERAIRFLLSKGVQISSSGSEGGYLTIFELTAKFPAPAVEYHDMSILCGTFPPEKTSLYLYYSIEKAVRLISHLIDGHKTSRESMNEEMKEFPGAIYPAKNRIYSFSGLGPQWDEFLSVLVHYFDRAANKTGEHFDAFMASIPDIFVNKGLQLITATDEEKELMIRAVKDVVSFQVLA